MNVADMASVSQSALDVLWRASWQGSVLVGLVLVAQWLLRKRAAARWRYNLWAVVLIRLALPVTPSSSWSVFNLLPDRREELPARKVEYARAAAPVAPRPEAMRMVLPQRGEMVQPTTKAAVVTASAPEVIRAAEPVMLRSESAQKKVIAGEPVGGAAGWSSWYRGAAGVRLAGAWLMAAWLAGVLVLAVRIAWASIGLQLAVRRLAEVDDWDVLEILEQASLEIGVTRRLRVLVAPIVSTPALMGVIRPKLLLPPGVLKNFNPQELRLIFLHELAHLQRHDVLINWVMTLLLVVHWFNPVVWLAVSRMRQDRELACDERVLSLSVAGELTRERRTYGLTILKLLESLSDCPAKRARATAGLVGILEGGQPLKRRIAMIAHFETRGRFWAMSALGSMLVIGCVALTDSVKDKPATPASAPKVEGETANVASTQPLVRDKPSRRAPAAGDPFAMKELEAQVAKAQAEAKAQMLEAQKLLAADPPKVADAKIKQEYANAKLAEMAAIKARMEALHADDFTIRRNKSVAWFGAEPMDEAMAKLQRRLPEARFEKQPLSEVLDWFRDILDVNLVVNSRALEAAGIDMNTPVSVRLKDVTGEKLLNVIAEQVGGGTIKLGFVVDDNTITFSTDEDLSKYVVSRAYNVQDMIANATTRPTPEGIVSALDSLSRVVQENVSPDSWAESGGTVGTISTFGTTLVIKQTPTNQREVEKLLAEIRSAGGKPAMTLVSPSRWEGPVNVSGGGFGAQPMPKVGPQSAAIPLKPRQEATTQPAQPYGGRAATTQAR